MQDLTDDELMVMYRRGDPEAFELLFLRHNAAVYNFARRMLNDANAAEDVVQDTFLALAQAAQEYRPAGHFAAWLLRICRNRCLNLLQSRSLRRRVAAEMEGLSDRDPSGSSPLRQDMEAKEKGAIIERAISDLPERQRESIILYAFERMAYREIAEVLGIPIGTVKTLIHRARAGLARALLSEEGGKHGV